MRIAVAGATGLIGRSVMAALNQSGHDAVGISGSHGIDAYSGVGLEAALEGVDAVVDCLKTAPADGSDLRDFFGTTTANLLAAERRAGVRHHVLLSVVGIDRCPDVPHYAGKREQERRVVGGPVPWTVVRSTQFHDFAAQVALRAARDGVAPVAPLLVQPSAPADVGRLLVEVAAREPLLSTIEVAGPQTEDLVDMARRTFRARGQRIALVPTWRGTFGVDMAGEVLLPGEDALLTPTSFEDWLATDAS